MPKLRQPPVRLRQGHSSAFTHTDRNDEKPPTLAQLRRERATSCVYFVECGEWVKIGTTTMTAERRFASMQLPPNAALVAVIPGLGRDAEQGLHRMFAAYRVSGEWFTRCPELSALIEANAV